jgi:hypothetical protein
MDEIKPSSLSFAVYDFFGYLLPGFFLICILLFEYDFGKAITYYLHNNLSFNKIYIHESSYKLPYLMKFLSWEHIPTDFKLVPFILLIIFCYLIGHILAALSSTILEKFILSQLIGYPSNNLFEINRKDTSIWYRKFFRWLTKRYCQPFDTAFKSKVKETVNARFGYEVNEHDYYWLCFTDIVRKMPSYYQRVQHFVSLYGFTRNTCAAFLLYVPLRLLFKIIYICLGIPFSIHPTNALILLLYLLIGTFLYTAYLKHYRRQTVEMFFAFYSLHTDKSKSNE